MLQNFTNAKDELFNTFFRVIIILLFLLYFVVLLTRRHLVGSKDNKIFVIMKTFVQNNLFSIGIDTITLW